MILRHFIKVFTLFYVFGASVAYSDTRYAASCSFTDIQAAVTASLSGDTVIVPGGTCTWSNSMTLGSSKAITLQGTGTTIKRVNLGNVPLINISTNSAQSTTVTGFNFRDESTSDQGFSGAFIQASGSPANAKFRIYNNTFTVESPWCGNVKLHIRVVGQQFGLIDNNTFNFSTASEVIHNEGYGSGSDAGWMDDVSPGSINAVYIENNKFWNTPSCRWVTGSTVNAGANSAVQNYYGARTVFRYNTVQMANVDAHGTAGMIGARWYEIYENSWLGVPNGNMDKMVQLRGGSGVVFNNTWTSSGSVLNTGIKMYEEDSGTYPLPYQVGRGKKSGSTFASEPVYIWGNSISGTSFGETGGDSYVQQNRDYYVGIQRTGYTPLIYPHPLISIVFKQPNYPVPTIQ